MSEISQTEHFESHPLQLSGGFLDKLESITARKAEVATDIIETEKSQEAENPAPKRSNTTNDEEALESPPSPKEPPVIIEQERDQVEDLDTTELPKISDSITPEFIEKLESITAGQAVVVEQLNEAEGDEEKKVLAPPPISSNAPPAPPPPAAKSSSSSNNSTSSAVLEELTKQNKNLTQLVEKSLNATGISSGTGNEAELQKQITELKRALEEERAAHAATKQLSSAPVFIQGSEFSESSSSRTILEGNPLSVTNLYTVVKPKKHAFFLPSWVVGMFRLATVLWIFFVVKLTKIVSVNILRTDKDEFSRYLQ